MLHLPLKSTEKHELHKSLYRFVEMAYSSHQAEDHRDAFHDAEQLRERVRQATLTEKGAAETVRLLVRYQRLLTTVLAGWLTVLIILPIRMTFPSNNKNTQRCCCTTLPAS